MRLIVVSSIIPPEHSGAGKRMYNYYLYRKSLNNDVALVTMTVGHGLDDHIDTIRPLFGRSTHPLLFPLVLVSVIIQIWISFAKRGVFKNADMAIWLTSCNVLTFASTIVLLFSSVKVITQNTLIGSDDPTSTYRYGILNLKTWLKRLQYYRSSCVVALSPALRDATRLRHNNVVLIPNPVDTSAFRPTLSIDTRRQQRYLLYVGRPTYRKGIDILLQVGVILQRVDPELTLVLVGPSDGLEEMVTDLRLGTNAQGLSNLRIVGYTSEVQYWYRRASILFLPSRREGFGTAYIEAMAAGLPVVAKEIPGITDYIFGLDRRYVINSDDPSVYANAILELLSSPERYANEVIVNRELVTKFGVTNIFRQYDMCVDV